MTAPHFVRVTHLAGLLALAAIAATPGRRPPTLPYAIRVTNPADHAQTVNVRSSLPTGLRIADISPSPQVRLVYDISENRYFALANIELQPREERTLHLHIRDIWAIPSNEVAQIRAQATAIAGELDWTKVAGEADGSLLKLNRILTIAEDLIQAPPAAGRRIYAHIAKCQRARLVLRDAHDTLLEFEDLAFQHALPPQTLVAQPRPLDRHPPLPADALGTRKLQFALRNTSPHMARELDISLPLPHELDVDDVLTADNAAYTVEQNGRHSAMVFHGLKLAPNEERVVLVEVVDRWRANDFRIRDLSEQVAILGLELKRYGTPYAPVAEKICELEDALAAEAAAHPPEAGSDYVAFRREQADRLNRIQGWIQRVERIPGTAERIGAHVPAPTPKTTWLIIYAIIAFMGFVTIAVLIQARRQTLIS